MRRAFSVSAAPRPLGARHRTAIGPSADNNPTHRPRAPPPPSPAPRCQTCKLWRSVGQDDRIWRLKALERWPPKTVRLGEYDSYLAMVQDDNKRVGVCA